MGSNGSMRRVRLSDLRVDPAQRSGWIRGNERTPEVGETVYCIGGEGALIALHGKTGDGSRLLQIRLADEKAPPFFAAASNVLVRAG